MVTTPLLILLRAQQLYTSKPLLGRSKAPEINLRGGVDP